MNENLHIHYMKNNWHHHSLYRCPNEAATTGHEHGWIEGAAGGWGCSHARLRVLLGWGCSHGGLRVLLGWGCSRAGLRVLLGWGCSHDELRVLLGWGCSHAGLRGLLC